MPGLSELILQAGKVELFPPGAVVAEQGTAVSQFIMPLSHSLRLQFSSGGVGNNSLVGYLQRSRVLSLREMLDGLPHPFSAVAEKPTRALLLPAAPFLQLVQGSPKIWNYLSLITSSGGIRNFRTFLVESGVSQDEVIHCVSRIPPANRILRAGEYLENREPGLFFVQSGRLRVTRVSSFGSPLDSAIGEGAWFGGEALVAPHRVSYEVVADQESSLHFVRLGEIRDSLVKFGMIEAVYAEPWLQMKTEPGSLTSVELDPLSGEELSPKSLRALSRRLGITIDPARLLRSPQAGDAEAISLANLALLQGGALNFNNVRAAIHVLDRVSFIRLGEIVEQHGWSTRVIRSSPEALANEPGVGLIAVGARLCVFLAADANRISVIDPVGGPVRVERRAFERNWDGTFLELSVHGKGQEEEEERNPPPPWARTERASADAQDKVAVHRMPPGGTGTMVNILLLALASLGLSMLVPYLSQLLLDEAVGNRDRTMLVTCVSGLVLTLLFSALTATARRLCLVEFGTRYDLRLSSRLYQSALSAGDSVTGSLRVGDVLARLFEVRRLRAFLSGNSVQAVLDLLSIAIFAAILFSYDRDIGYVSLAFFSAVVLVRLAMKNPLRKKLDATFWASAESKSMISEQVSAITAIRSCNAEGSMCERWEEMFVRGVKSRQSTVMIAASTQLGVSILAAAARVGALYLAAMAAVDGKLTAGKILAVSMYLDRVIAPSSSLASLISELEGLRISFEKIAQVFRAPPERPASEAGNSHSLSFSGKIKLDRVEFRYGPEADWVLRNLSLTIFPRQIVAIVGRSGCGKTTLANLIAGNLKPSGGRIFFDDFDSSYLSLSSLRNQVGFIMQSNDLFGGTLADNIAWTDDAPEMPRIEAAGRDANLSDFVEKLVDGYDHTLGETGIGLSVGQKQRLSIARTLYRDPRILLLDEATSALDADSEKLVMESIRRILKDRTAIVIAHRLSTVRNADRILVMRSGQIVEDGSHAELMLNEGHYFELFQNQLNLGES